MQFLIFNEHKKNNNFIFFVIKNFFLIWFFKIKIKKKYIS